MKDSNIQLIEKVEIPQIPYSKELMSEIKGIKDYLVILGTPYLIMEIPIQILLLLKGFFHGTEFIIIYYVHKPMPQVNI